MTSFAKDFDQLLDSILTDYRNQSWKDPATGQPMAPIDTSQGSLVFIKSACLASALWGLYKYQDYVARQIFPDTADDANLLHHAWVRGLDMRAGETSDALLARLLDYIRQPPAGGNKYDYVKWALTIDHVAGAWCIPLAQGDGTVDVVILADATATGDEIPSSYQDLRGSATSVSAGKLVDTAATFQTSGVAVGDTVNNATRGGQTTVSSVDSETQLTLATDIFTAAGQVYTIPTLTGAVTSVSAGKLVDSAATFQTSGVAPGDIVENTSQGTYTTVSSVDSETQLTLAADIFTSAGQGYAMLSLVQQVYAYIDDVRPVTASTFRVLAPTVDNQDMALTVWGDDIDTGAIQASVSAYVNGLNPGDDLLLSRLISLVMLIDGVTDVAVTTPAANVAAAADHLIRPGAITVTKGS